MPIHIVMEINPHKHGESKSREEKKELIFPHLLLINGNNFWVLSDFGNDVRLRTLRQKTGGTRVVNILSLFWFILGGTCDKDFVPV